MMPLVLDNPKIKEQNSLVGKRTWQTEVSLTRHPKNLLQPQDLRTYFSSNLIECHHLMVQY